MAPRLKTLYEKQEDIPEGFSELYAERNGRFELTGIEGVKTQADIDRVNEGLRKERADHKATKDALAKFGELNPDEVPAQLERLSEVEAQLATITKDGKLDETKIAERIQAAVNTAVGPLNREKTSLEKQLDAQKKATAEQEARAVALQNTIKSSKIEGALRDAAIGEKVIASAIDDAVMNGSRVFELNEESGSIQTRDGVGVTPGLSPKEWLKDMQEKRPHWWPPSLGGGAGGARGTGNYAGKDNPFSKDGWNMTKQGQLVKELGEAKANEIAVRAGTKLGGPRPTT